MEMVAPFTPYGIPMEITSTEVVSPRSSRVPIAPWTAEPPGTTCATPFSSRRHGESRLSPCVGNQLVQSRASSFYDDCGVFDSSLSWCDSVSTRQVRVDPPQQVPPRCPPPVTHRGKQACARAKKIAAMLSGAGVGDSCSSLHVAPTYTNARAPCMIPNSGVTSGTYKQHVNIKFDASTVRFPGSQPETRPLRGRSVAATVKQETTSRIKVSRSTTAGGPLGSARFDSDAYGRWQAKQTKRPTFGTLPCPSPSPSRGNAFLVESIRQRQLDPGKAVRSQLGYGHRPAGKNGNVRVERDTRVVVNGGTATQGACQNEFIVVCAREECRIPSVPAAADSDKLREVGNHLHQKSNAPPTADSKDPKLPAEPSSSPRRSATFAANVASRCVPTISFPCPPASESCPSQRVMLRNGRSLSYPGVNDTLIRAVFSDSSIPLAVIFDHDKNENRISRPMCAGLRYFRKHLRLSTSLLRRPTTGGRRRRVTDDTLASLSRPSAVAVTEPERRDKSPVVTIVVEGVVEAMGRSREDDQRSASLSPDGASAFRSRDAGADGFLGHSDRSTVSAKSERHGTDFDDVPDQGSSTSLSEKEFQGRDTQARVLDASTTQEPNDGHSQHLPESPLNLRSRLPTNTIEPTLLRVDGVKRWGSSVPQRPSTAHQLNRAARIADRRPSSSPGGERAAHSRLEQSEASPDVGSNPDRSTVDGGQVESGQPPLVLLQRDRGREMHAFVGGILSCSQGDSASFGHGGDTGERSGYETFTDNFAGTADGAEGEDYSCIYPDSGAGGSVTTFKRRRSTTPSWDSSTYGGDDGSADVAAARSCCSLPSALCVEPEYLIERGILVGAMDEGERDSQGRHPYDSPLELELYVKAPGEPQDPFCWSTEGQQVTTEGELSSFSTPFSRYLYSNGYDRRRLEDSRADDRCQGSHAGTADLDGRDCRYQNQARDAPSSTSPRTAQDAKDFLRSVLDGVARRRREAKGATEDSLTGRMCGNPGVVGGVDPLNSQ